MRNLEKMSSVFGTVVLALLLSSGAAHAATEAQGVPTSNGAAKETRVAADYTSKIPFIKWIPDHRNLIISSGQSVKCIVDGVFEHMYANWFIDKNFQEQDEPDFWNGYYDRTFERTYYADALVEANLHDTDYKYKTTYTWNITVDDGPPTPDIMRFSTAPYAISTTQIEMWATTASDQHGPVEYYFGSVYPGSDRDWDADRSYTDDRLPTNTRGGYAVKARDNLDRRTSYSGTKYAYSWQTVPTINFGQGNTGDTTKIKVFFGNVSNLSGGNSGACSRIALNGKTINESSWYRSSMTWTDLTPGRKYTISGRGRNGDAIITDWGSWEEACAYPALPKAPTVTAEPEPSVNINPGLNDAGVTFAIFCTTNGDYVTSNGKFSSTATWQLNSQWAERSIPNLPKGIWSFKVKARDACGSVQSKWSLVE